MKFMQIWDIVHKITVEIGVIGLSIWHFLLWMKDKEEAVNWLETHIERRHPKMVNGLAQKVAEGFQVLNIALANGPKILADIAAAEAAEKDPIAEMAALSKLLADLQPAVNALVALVPQPAQAAAQEAPAPSAPASAS